MGFLDNMAKKAFEKPDVQKSWQIHMQAFGPILEPAFSNDYSSRIHLTAALNCISRGDIMGGLKKLNPLRKACVHDADLAALSFVLGLAMEQAGELRHAVEMYMNTNSYNHRFYLPYLKVARFAFDDLVYDTSEENYRKAIACFDGTGLNEQDKTILGSIYTNLATCLTMMHRYDDAEAALGTSRQLVPEASGRSATEAILYAAQGRRDLYDASMHALEQNHPDAVEATRQLTDPIWDGTSVHFFPAEVPEDAPDRFWDWFLENRQQLEEKAGTSAAKEFLPAITDLLSALFPLCQQEPEFGIWKDEHGCHMDFVDSYSATKQNGYSILIQNAPEELNQLWSFEIVH